MDQAVYVPNTIFPTLPAVPSIIGIRGNRVFKCDPTTGAITAQTDLGPFAWGKACIAFDSGTNKIFAAAWNTPHYAIQVISGFNEHVSQRNLYRLNPSTLAVELTADIASSFSLGNQNGVLLQAGFCAMDSAGGNIYCRWWSTSNIGASGGSLRFSAANIATFHNGSESVAGDSPNLSYGNVGGADTAIWCDQSSAAGVTSGEVILFNYSANVENTFNTSPTNGILSAGFAPSQQHIFITDVAQFIYVYTTAGALVTTINTGRSAFNGLVVRYDSTDGNIYVPGGNDGTMCIINPATNTFSIVSGFDVPVDYVRAGTIRFAVQAGSTPLKSF